MVFLHIYFVKKNYHPKNPDPSTKVPIRGPPQENLRNTASFTLPLEGPWRFLGQKISSLAARSLRNFSPQTSPPQISDTCDELPTQHKLVGGFNPFEKK